MNGKRPSYRPRNILSVATDCCFRTTLEEVLKRAGHTVTSVPQVSDALRRLSAASDAFDIVVVCDCIPEKDRARLTAILKATSSPTPMLLIGDKRKLLTDGAIWATDRPEELLNAVEALLDS